MGNIVVTVTSPPRCFDPLEHFRSEEGAAVLQFYKEGAVLRAPEGSSPHHWWLELADGHEVSFLHHSHIGGALRDISQATAAGNALLHKSYSGKSRKVGGSFVYDDSKMQTLKENWAIAKACARDWHAAAGALNKDVRGLSFRALGLVRCLKRRYAICMHPELHPELVELNQRGLLHITPEGGVRLSVSSTSLPVSDGFSVFLKYSPN